METFIFIHGSSAGQCSLTVNAASSKLCDEIGRYYFEGRENRQMMGIEGAAMFAELFRSSNNQTYCLYSYVINACLGPAPDLRAGNYFALTIALNGRYCKEAGKVFNLLSNAYKQIISGRIIEDTLSHGGKTYRYVYKVPQLQSIGSEIATPLGLALDFFNRDCEPYCISLPPSIHLPLPWNGGSLTVKKGNNVVRLPWNGIGVHPDECDSREAISHLLSDGRIVVHEKAEKYADRLLRIMNEKKQLASQVESLQQQLETVKHQHAQQVASAAAANKAATMAETDRLKKENRNLQDKLDTYNGLIDQLAKYQRTTQNNITHAVRDFNTEASRPKTWTRWLKAVVLMLILLISITCLIFNICFFRNMPPCGNTPPRQEHPKDTSSILDDPNQTVIKPNETPVGTVSSTSGNTSTANTTSSSYLDKYSSTGSSSATKTAQKNVNYGLRILDEDGKEIEKVKPGQRIKAIVSQIREGCDFHFWHCNKEGNDTNPIWVRVDSTASGSITVSYGPNSPSDSREKKSLKVQS